MATLATITLALIMMTSIPAHAHAATYAFVNNSGEVSIVAASSPEAALATAFNISIHSGVMLLQSQLDAIVGFHVSL
jgi:hypothetical protein